VSAIRAAVPPEPTNLPAQPRAIDFACVGFGGDGSVPPVVPAVFVVHPTGGDDTAQLQAALDRAAALPLRPDGWRGAVQLTGGTYQVFGKLHLDSTGVVLRGAADHATIITAAGHSRRTLIELGQRTAPATATPVRIVDDAVPVGASTLTVESTNEFQVGDLVSIIRPSTAAWIADLGMRGFPGTYAETRLDWTPGSRDLTWDRSVVTVDPARHQIVLDAPITTALESRYGGGVIARFSSIPSFNIGIEDLVLDSAFDPANPCDEEHSWIAIALHTVRDCWVRNVTARHFAGSAVRVGPHARRITVDSCRCERPVSEPGGYRRQSFLVEGQQVLAMHCAAEAGMNDFAVGLCAAGPNVFFDCTATAALGPSGAFESWASGVLYENVRIDGAGIRLARDMTRAQGAGWTAANSIVSNCQAKDFDVVGPASASNQLINSSSPLYRENPERKRREIPRLAAAPEDFVLPQRPPEEPVVSRQPSLQIIHGRFVVGDRTLWGGAVNDAWWKGQVTPATAPNFGVSLTRFVPGRDGPGLTEDLPALAARMAADGTPFYRSGPGLWYDRHRDEHSIVQRPDGNVWAPFCEFPWARSGRFTAGLGAGKNVAAWDGLSRYDLTRFNTWYFERNRAFADLCLQHGLLLIHSLYNTHNLLEWGAHWIDFPWRPANNVNETGLAEPPPLEPNDRIHFSNSFYNVDDPRRRALHHAYIFHVLDELGAAPNVIFDVGYQFPGPLAFEEFFVDTVIEWEKQTGRTVRLELATSKDITDAILANPVRSQLIAVIDQRYWQYRPDGALWAPAGGSNLAFREIVKRDFGDSAGAASSTSPAPAAKPPPSNLFIPSSDFPPATTAPQLYRQVREYRDRFPDKAIIAWHGGIGPAPILLAGGAACLNRNPTGGHGQSTPDRIPFDALIQQYLATSLMNLLPRDGLVQQPATTWCLSDDRNQTVLIYSLEGATIAFAHSLAGTYSTKWLNPNTGAVDSSNQTLEPKEGTVLAKPTPGDWLLLLQLRR
jgi:hypothetical protein